MHRECAGGNYWGPGPRFCDSCWNDRRDKGQKDVTTDRALMYRVSVGVCHPEWPPAVSMRCDAAARFLRWDGEKLWIQGEPGTEREIVPPGDRKELVKTTAQQLGYPGGRRLYALLRERYYWAAM